MSKPHERRWATHAGLVFIILFGSLTFLFKPVHVDDPNYLGVTVRVLAKPWDPFGGQPVWLVGEWFQVNANPPLWSYTYAVVAWLWGWDEIGFHLVQALAYAAFVYGVFRLTERIAGRPLLWTMCISFGPFVLPGVNLMLDLPMLAFWVWALEWQLRAWDDNDTGKAWLAGLLCGLAILIKYSAGLLLLLFIFGAWRTRQAKSLVSLVLPILLLGMWCCHNYVIYGRLHLFAHSGEVSWLHLHMRLLVLVRNVGSVFWLAPVWALAIFHGSISRYLAGTSVLILAGLVGLLDATQAARQLAASEMIVDWVAWSQYLLFTANGVLALAAVLITLPGTWRRQPLIGPVFVTWFVTGLLFNLLLVPEDSFGAIRHLAIFLVPMVYIAAWVLEQRSTTLRRKLMTYSHAGIMMALGMLLAWADLDLAKAYKNAAQSMMPNYRHRGNVWFTGDPSFRYYAQQFGAQMLPPPGNRQAVRKGDVLIIPYLQGGATSDPQLANLDTQIHEELLWSLSPVYTVSPSANYYGGTSLSLPWQIASTLVIQPNETPFFAKPPLEEFHVFRIPSPGN